jgi:hypothetical protein
MAAKAPAMPPAEWSDEWLAMHGPSWMGVAQTIGPCNGGGVRSEWWPDQAIGVGPGLIALGFAMLLAWHENDAPPQQRNKRAKRQPARAESLAVEQLALPI